MLRSFTLGAVRLHEAGYVVGTRSTRATRWNLSKEIVTLITLAIFIITKVVFLTQKNAVRMSTKFLFF